MSRIWNGLVFVFVGLGCGTSSRTSDDSHLTSPPPTPVDAAAPVVSLSDSLGIADVGVYQGVKVSLVKAATVAKPNAPIVIGRPALVRVGVTPADGWKATALDAELHLVEDGKEIAVLTDSKKIYVASTDSDIDTTFNFKIDPATLTGKLSYSIVIRDPKLSPDPAVASISFPADGTAAPFGAQTGGEQIKIKFVPVNYQYSSALNGADAGAPDASAPGLLPDTGATQMARYHDTLMKMYPVAKVDITVREPMPWTQEILPDGTGWDSLITAVMDLRATDQAPDDVFYVGLFIATSSIDDFCANGCVLGVAQLSDAADVTSRMALITGYPNQMSADTLNQELGHALGREHADCGGADSPDIHFPYKKGAIGVWGWDLLRDELVDPTTDVRDFMGYCSPIWISDYTYSALFTRISYVNGRTHRTMASQKYRAVHVAADGALQWGREVTLTSAPVGEPRDVTLVSADGTLPRHVQGHFYPHDTLRGGFVLIPEVDAAVSRVRVRMKETDTREARRP